MQILDGFCRWPLVRPELLGDAGDASGASAGGFELDYSPAGSNAFGGVSATVSPQDMSEDEALARALQVRAVSAEIQPPYPALPHPTLCGFPVLSLSVPQTPCLSHSSRHANIYPGKLSQTGALHLRPGLVPRSHMHLSKPNAKHDAQEEEDRAAAASTPPQSSVWAQRTQLREDEALARRLQQARRPVICSGPHEPLRCCQSCRHHCHRAQGF